MLLAAFLFLPITGRAQSATPDSPTYGVYPENYQELLTAWLDRALVDPRSVVVKWLGPPKQGQLKVAKDRQVAGYLVDFTVNARNVFGAYTGPQKHTALIRDGKVVTATGFVYR
ncbi:MAG: hypothetical protein ABI362_03165 [Chthoniobacterales bacterium]